MKRILFALLVLTPQLLLAQPGTTELETRLAAASGEERLDLLTQLTAALSGLDAERAVTYGSEAIELLASFPDEDRELQLSSSLCEANLRLGDYARAMQLATRAEQLARAGDHGPALIRALEHLGSAYQGLGDPASALASFRESLKLARESGEKPAIAGNLLAIGRIHLAAGRVPAAAETLRRGLTAATEADAPQIVQDVHLSLSQAYAAMGRYQQAYGSLRRHEDLRRETEGRRTAERIAELEANLESAREQGEADTSAQQQQAQQQQQQRTADLESGHRRLKNLALAGGGGLLLLMLLTLFSRQRLAGRTSRIIAAREQEIGQKTEELEGSTEELGRITERLDQTLVELDNANFELNRASSDRDRVASKLERIDEELERMSALFDRTSVKLAETSSQLDQTTAELDLTRRELDHAATEREGAAKEVEDSSSRFDELTASYRQDIAELGDRNAATRDRLAEMERFTSTVTQHLKVILITIRGSLGALQQDAVAGDVPQLRKDIERTYGTVGKMVRLLDELLKLLLVGRIVKAPEEVSMSELAFEAVGQVSGLVGDRRVEIVIEPGMPEVFGDRSQLLEVLCKLLENGGKFMGLQPAPRLEVTSRQDGEQTVFCVRDNGIGIDPHDHERVFTLFEQIDPEVEGPGIGLAYIKRILETHGGRVWVESAGEGQGSTFCFTVAEARASTAVPPDASS